MKNDFYCFLKLIPKFSDFVNYEVCIGKIISKSIRLKLLSIKIKDLKLIKNRFFSGEKMINSHDFEVPTNSSK